jgi:hypothetical protein
MAADVLDIFIRDFAEEEWLGFSSDTRDIATKAKTRSGGSEYSVAERAEALCSELQLKEPIRIAAIDLLAKWRNVVAHRSNKRLRLDTDHKKVLLENTSEIARKYCHFDIQLALRNFEEQRLPVPKEVTSLVAMATNFARRLDEGAIRRSASTPHQVTEVAESVLRAYFRQSDERKCSPWREVSNDWQGGVSRRAVILKKWLAQLGITESKTPISAFLPPVFIDDIASLNLDDFVRRFEIARPTALSHS